MGIIKDNLRVLSIALGDREKIHQAEKEAIYDSFKTNEVFWIKQSILKWSL